MLTQIPFDHELLIKLDRRIRRLNNLMNGRQEGTNKYYEYKRTLKAKTHERHLLIWRYMTELCKVFLTEQVGTPSLEDFIRLGLVDPRDRILKTLIEVNEGMIPNVLEKLTCLKD